MSCKLGEAKSNKLSSNILSFFILKMLFERQEAKNDSSIAGRVLLFYLLQ